MNDELNKEREKELETQTQGSFPPPQQNPGNPYYSSAPEKMTGIGEAYKSYWKNYVNFNDRTSRAGYWWVILVNGIIGIVLERILIAPAVEAGILNPSLDAAAGLYASYGASFAAMFSGLGIIYFLWGVANLLPSLALFIRRLHDTGRRWGWIFLVLIPFVGWIILFIFTLLGTKYPPENRLGSLPRQA